MKIKKLKLTNFSPYYGEANEIVLYDDQLKEKNVTLNIGPTGNGKTSISRAVMWCLFGETFEPRWEPMVNDLAKTIAMEINQDKIKMAVEMETDINGETFLILRSGYYECKTKKREANSQISIRSHGTPLKNPLDFINENFLPHGLMEYFIFDADDMLRLFEYNQEKTIKDLINKIVGVESLDNTIDTLKNVKNLYEDDIEWLIRKSPGISQEDLNKEKEQQRIKQEAINELEGQVIELERKKTLLFPKGQLSSENVRLNEVMNSLHEAEDELKDLNKSFEADANLISNIHLVFLDDIIQKSNDFLNTSTTTKNEFDSAIDIVKSTIEGKYAGIVLDNDDTMLLRRGVKIKDTELDDPDQLNLSEGPGFKVSALEIINEFDDTTTSISNKYKKLKEKYDGATDKLLQSRNLMRQIGDTDQNRELKKNIEEFLNIDGKISDLKQVIDATQSLLDKINERIENITKKLKTTKENEDKIQEIRKKNIEIDNMISIVEESKETFLTELLENVNREATKFFQGIRRDDDVRLSTITVDADYKLNVKDINGVIIPPQTINKGNTQIALMAFFFGLSKFLEKKLPYIIDDPLIRLDMGHVRRLIQHLCNSPQQIIMHLIPGNEYQRDIFEWVKPYINTQNWINREKDPHQASNLLRSYVERKDPSKFVEFDINKL